MNIGKVQRQRGFEYLGFEAHNVAAFGSKTPENKQRVVGFKCTRIWLSVIVKCPANYHRNRSIVALSIYIRYTVARIKKKRLLI